MAFFPPFVTKIGGKPFICYTDEDIAKYFAGTLYEDDAKDLIREFDSNWFLTQAPSYVPDDTDFMIGFLWTDGKETYIDIWLNRQLATYGECGPMKTLQSFRHNGEFIDCWDKGNGCDWTNIVTGREAEYRRAIMNTGGALDTYINGPRPEMPEGFIIPWPDTPNPDLAGKGTWI